MPVRAEASSVAGVLPSPVTEYWDAAMARLRNLSDRLLRLASAERSLVCSAQGRSIVGWKGDLATVWVRATNPDERKAHSPWWMPSSAGGPR